MYTAKLMSKLPKARAMRNTVVVACAAVAALAAQSAMSPANALTNFTLNGTFQFEPTGNGSPGTFMSNPAASLAYGVGTASALTLNPNLPELIGNISPTYDGKASDFYLDPAYGMSPLSQVFITSPVTFHPNDPFNAAGFTTPLTDTIVINFANTFGPFSGTTPDDRYSYTATAGTWFATAANPNTLTLDSFGLVTDTDGYFKPNAAKLDLVLDTTCAKYPNGGKSICNNVLQLASWTFSTDGTGHGQTVPEPISLSILGIGLAGLALVRRRGS